MNILTRINNFTTLSDARLKQLNRKEEQNVYLNKHCDKCPNSIIKYFINEHKINRLQRILETKFLSFPIKTKNLSYQHLTCDDSKKEIKDEY